MLALMLTLCAWLIDYLAALPAKLRLLAALPLFAFLAYFVGLDYSVNYHRETSLLMALPFAALAVLLVIVRQYFLVALSLLLLDCTSA